MKISSIIRITSSTTATSCVYTQQPTNNHFFQQMLLRLAQTLVNSTAVPIAFICVYFRFCFLLFVFITACFSCVSSAQNKVYDDDDDNDDKSVQQPLMVSNSNLPFPLPSLPTPTSYRVWGSPVSSPNRVQGHSPCCKHMCDILILENELGGKAQLLMGTHLPTRGRMAQTELTWLADYIP